MSFPLLRSPLFSDFRRKEIDRWNGGGGRRLNIAGSPFLSFSLKCAFERRKKSYEPHSARFFSKCEKRKQQVEKWAPFLRSWGINALCSRRRGETFSSSSRSLKVFNFGAEIPHGKLAGFLFSVRFPACVSSNSTWVSSYCI